jgi:molybdopterin/thiamine biosynthesis adenylyltransferase
MTQHYTLNPFSFVTETESMIMLNTTSRMRAQFAKRHRPIIDMLIARGSVPADELGLYLAPTRMRELVAKRILLPGVPPSLEGRYSRQLGFLGMLSSNPEAIQARIGNAHVLILGAGAVGSHVLWNLAAMGVGHLTVVDFDVVEETNLNRQLMYTPEDIGELKADVLCAKMRTFNPALEINAVKLKIQSEEDIANLLPGCDLVVKAIDTPEQSTAWLNKACVASGIPFVTGGFLDYVGVVGPIYVPGRSLCADCYTQAGHVRRLHGTGPTFAPLTTIVSSMLAMTVFKLLIGDVDTVVDRLHSYDSTTSSWNVERLTATKKCETCGTAPEPVTRPTTDPLTKRVWSYRAAILAILGISIIIRDGFAEPLVGGLTLSTVLLSVPVLWFLMNGDSERTRRELFVISCMYIALSAMDVGLGRLGISGFGWPQSFEQAFAFIQSAGTAILEITIGVTVHFFLLSGVLSLTKRLSTPRETAKA